jgi:uncharacterized membrane protein
MKYLTFNATFLDLGLNNEVLWLNLHGTYFASQFQYVYPFQFQSVSSFVLLPFYALYPHPEGALVIQACLLGFSSIPLYLCCRTLFRFHTPALVLAGAYLLYFPLQGANMFDFHFEKIFPFFFLWSFYFLLSNRRGPFYLTLVIAALVNSVTLIESVGLVLYVIGITVSKSEGTFAQRLRQGLRPDRLIFIVGFLTYLSSVVLFQSQSLNITQSTYNFSLGGIAHAVSANPWFYVFLFVPLVFLPFLDLPLLLVALPYFAWTATVLTPAGRQLFYHQYPLMIAPILFLSAAIGVARISGRLHLPAVAGNSADSRIVRANHFLARPPPQRRRRARRPVGLGTLSFIFVSILTATVATAAIYDPLGPWNSTLPKNVFQGNYGISYLLTPTAHDALLWKTIGLIPPDGSVLAQTGLPQVSGRPHVAIAGFPTVPGFTYQYFLGDYSHQNFTSEFNDFRLMFPYVRAAVINGTYGFVVLSNGVFLMENGFHGSPSIFSTPNDTFPASSLDVISGLRTDQGATITHYPSMGPANVSWFGPYAVALLPGPYRATFQVKYAQPIASSCPLVTLQVANDLSRVTLGKRALTLADFSGPGIWRNFSINFTATGATESLEYRGIDVSTCAAVTVRQVVATYLGTYV